LESNSFCGEGRVLNQSWEEALDMHEKITHDLRRLNSILVAWKKNPKYFSELEIVGRTLEKT
jgi:hypothetical protein